MQTIDRYLILQFLRIFFMTFACLMGMYVIGEFVTNFSEFMEYRQSTDRFGQAVAMYYGARVPLFFNLAGHIVALLSAVLAISWMQRHNEFTSLQAAGISRWRIVKPLIMTTAIIAICGVINRELFVPAVRDWLVNDVRDLVESRPRSLTAHYDNSTDILFDGEAVYPASRQIKMPKLRLPFAWGTRGHSLRAQKATFREATQGVPAGYLLEGVTESLQGLASVRADDQPIIYAPGDTTWLDADQCFVVSELRPNVLQGNHRWQQYASTKELISMLRGNATYQSPSLHVTVHRRFVRPFLDMALVFLGLPVALTVHRRNVVGGAAKSILVVAVFSLITSACHGMGVQNMVEPALAAWLPLLVLGPAAVLFSGPFTG